MNRDWNQLGARLNKWRPPPVDPLPSAPVEQWKYAGHSLVPDREGQPGGTEIGSLTIERRPHGAAWILRVVEEMRVGFTTMRVTAEIETGGTGLWTPTAWRLGVRWTANDPARVNAGELDQDLAGRVENGQLVWSAPKGRSRPAPPTWTDLWCLFAALSQTDGLALPVELEMTEHMDVWKPAQRLTDAGVVKVTVGGATRPWRVIEQIGRGVMPWRWWLDEGGRVVMAAGDRKVWLRTAVSATGDLP